MTSAPTADLRLRLHDATVNGLHADPKELPTLWLYDERGSRLYDEVTRLPDYYLPRREREILRAHAKAIAKRIRPRTLIELGAGSATNTRLLLDALVVGGTLESFVPLDVSEEALRTSARAIELAYPGVLVQPVAADFERKLDELPDGRPRLIALLGSTIGNLRPTQRHAFLRALADALAETDAFLVGVDLVKDAARLRAAYNDTKGVTERFVRNALVAVNRELNATFEQRLFDYEARWDPDHEWMDIGLRARKAHMVSIRRLELDVSFAEGEPLRVEVSSKFRRGRLESEARRAGLDVESWWTDPAGDFAVALMVATEAAPQ
jgi:L-histidine N-alpha-methyltransferase